jgi:hypothetical protein
LHTEALGATVDVGYPANPSSSGSSQAGIIYIIDDGIASPGIVNSITAYFRNTNPVTFQVIVVVYRVDISLDHNNLQLS